MAASPKSVCIPCRRTYKGEGREVMSDHDFKVSGRIQWPKKWMGVGSAIHHAPAKCPECSGKTIYVSYKWRPPKKRNSKAWKKIANGDWNWEH